MKKLKYRLIKAIATLLGCHYIIDQEEYDSVLPRRIKPYKGKLPEGLLTFKNPMREELYIEMGKQPKFYDKLKDMGLGRSTGKPFTHYEEPKEDKQP